MIKPHTNRLRVWRAERRLTQLALARKARLNPTRLSFIENDHVEATPAERERLAKALRATELEVFPGVRSEDGTLGASRSDVA